MVLNAIVYRSTLVEGVSNGVDAGLRLLRVRMAVDQLQSLVWLPTQRQSLCHGTERQRTGLQSTGSHHDRKRKHGVINLRLDHEVEEPVRQILPLSIASVASTLDASSPETHAADSDAA